MIMVTIRAITMRALPVLVMTAALLAIIQPATGQSTDSVSSAVAQEQNRPPQQQEDQKAETRMFIGKIVKSGDALVLAAPSDKKTYQLDDQEKAQQFVNKQVKITGILDSSSGIIRVRAIDPA